MNKPLSIAVLLLSLFLGSQAQGAGQRPADMTASPAIVGTQITWCPVGTANDYKCTFTQIDTFINAQFSGDFTCTSGGVCTLKNTGPGATGPIGSTTTVPVVTIDAQGRVTGLTSATAAATVSSISTTCGISSSPSPITTTGTIQATASPTTEAGANYAFLAADMCTTVYLNNASNQIPTIPQANTTGFENGKFIEVCNIGAGTQTITPTTSTIGGASTFVLPAASAAKPACIGVIAQSGNYVLDQTGPYTIGTAAAQNTGTSGANLPFLNGSNTWSGVQTFGNVFGTVTSQSGTTYTLASTDCGTEISFTNAAAVTVTIPAALTTGCNIAILQTTASGQVTVTGTAVSAATLHSGHSYTKTFGQWSIIGINIYTTGVAILTGDGA